MQKLGSIEEVREKINKSDAALLYVSAPNCQVCDALKPKIEELINSSFPKIKVFEANVADIPQLGAEYNIFSAPAILVFFDSKEFAREGRNISLLEFQKKIEKIYNIYFG